MKRKNLIFITIALLVGLAGWGMYKNGFLGEIPNGAATAGTTQQLPAELQFEHRHQVKAFIKKELEKPIPGDYQIPGYIASGLPLQQAYDSLAVRYPEFYGFSGEQFVDSVWRHPLRYKELIKENKAIRRYYSRRGDH